MIRDPSNLRIYKFFHGGGRGLGGTRAEQRDQKNQHLLRLHPGQPTPSSPSLHFKARRTGNRSQATDMAMNCIYSPRICVTSLAAFLCVVHSSAKQAGLPLPLLAKEFVSWFCQSGTVLWLHTRLRQRAKRCRPDHLVGHMFASGAFRQIKMGAACHFSLSLAETVFIGVLSHYMTEEKGDLSFFQGAKK